MATFKEALTTSLTNFAKSIAKTYPKTANIVDNLLSTDSTLPLSAKQGNVLQTQIDTLNSNLSVKIHTINLPSDWHGKCTLYDCGNIGAISFDAYCENTLIDNGSYPLFSVSAYGFKYGTNAIFRNNGANTTTIFSFLNDGTFFLEPHGGSAEANNYIKGTLIVFK